MPKPLYTSLEICSLLGISRQRLHQLRNTLTENDMWVRNRMDIFYKESALTKLKKRQLKNSKFKNKVK